MEEAMEKAMRALVEDLREQDFVKASSFDPKEWYHLKMDGNFDMKSAIDAFLAELLKTHAVVPRTPTEDMALAGSGWFDGETVMDRERSARAVYAAMLSASPRDPGND
jgi:hypothetical protein